ncbi:MULTISPECIES: RraA family protein [unclassified Shinella]|uniref:RraA family protein n=1 Tax=unclassified Shinella TaxID=2643062 RepID=UPI00225CE477|nr:MULTISPECIES: RraA family protein [unclassified Shinella]CAI0336214.1 RraA family protein [Rhizobiaceae bacterium]CAK7254760.1 4-hydroxy-4-methyl-2-oxoglutarate aldolase [Shinella sp. WSC3-e]MCO5136743.1 RraA family protein [Shinella sp.]MCW5711871.1 RraA family protein [Shinella sp.]MDC7253581.1 RraA family protein [Shinella sp. YE25]
MQFETYAKQLYTGVLSDVMDSLGRTSQAMRPFIRPVDDASVLMGRARTGLYATVYGRRDNDNPYELEMELVDSLTKDDVAVLACNGPTERIAPWGELLSTAAKMRGANGCVTDGLVRDTKHIKHLGFPVFHGGIGPLDSIGRAKMIEHDTEIICAGVTVRSGDIVFADIDGVVVIPQEIEQQVLDLAMTKATSENNSRNELLEGRLLREVYEKYGVL